MSERHVRYRWVRSQTRSARVLWKHYAQWRTSNGERICSVDECGRPATLAGGARPTTSGGRTTGHLPFNRDIRTRHAQWTQCDLPGRSKGMCQMHYARWKRHGDLTVLTVPNVRRI